MKKTFVILILALCLLSPKPVSADDFRLWSQYLFSLYQNDKVHLSLYHETRLQNDGSQAFGWFTGPKVTYYLHDNLWLGGALKHIELKGNDNIDGRLELEFIPRWKLSEHLRLDFRNRVEVFHERRESDSTRFRHRLRLTWLLKKEWLDRLFFSAELFHQDGDGFGDFTEDRVIPIGARFKLSERGSLDLFYLQRSRDRPDGREHIHVLGTFFILRR